ncbi:MAG: TolC family protein [Myxococcota bacterium]
MIGLLLLSLSAQPETWSVDRIAQRAIETSNGVAASQAELEEASTRRDRAFVDVLPRARVGFDYTRIGAITNDPLVDLDVDLTGVAADVAAVQDPAAQSALQAQLGVLQGLDGVRIDVPEERTAFRAELSYPVSALFLEILPGLRAAERAEEARAFQLEALRNDEALRAVEVYLRHVLAQQGRAVAERTIEEARLDLDQAKGRLRAGTATEPERLRFEARLAEAEGELAVREADVLSTRAALRALLDLEGEGPLSASEDVGRPQLWSTPKAAGGQEAPPRPELAAAELLVRAVEARKRSARGGAAPKLGVGAGVDVAQPNPLLVPPNTDRFRTTWRVSAGLSWSPDRAASAWLRSDELSAQARRARANLRAVQDQIAIEIATASARRSAAMAQLAAAERQVAAAGEALAGRREAYGSGLADATEVLAAEVQLEQARLLRVRSGTQALIEDARLRRAYGAALYE